jgi:hypothetical protein
LDSIKCEEFLYYLSDCELLKKDSAPWCSQLVKKAAIFPVGGSDRLIQNNLTLQHLEKYLKPVTDFS